MRLPTYEEINVYNSLDEITACKRFLNVTLSQAEQLCRESSLDFAQDLMWIGPIAFQFYLPAAINYVESDYAIGDSDIINCLSSVLEYRWAEPEFLAAAGDVTRLLDYVATHFEKFEVDAGIYGDLLGTYEKLCRRIQE
jgi:hypothetical protein